MKLAIIGSRTFSDFWTLEKWVFKFNPIKIISGGAIGADSLAEEYAKKENIIFEIFKPEWDKYGKSAGFIRNQQIIDACDIVLAFWDGKSKGTQDSINKAKLAKKPTFIVYF